MTIAEMILDKKAEVITELNAKAQEVQAQIYAENAKTSQRRVYSISHKMQADSRSQTTMRSGVIRLP